MKNKILKSITALLCIPLLFFCGCSNKNSKLETINLSTYYNSTVSATFFNDSKQKGLTLSDVTASKPNELLLDKYIQFEFKANASWVYKLYIDYIYFYVYTNMETESDMTLNLKMTNLADENNIEKPTDDFTADCALIPQKDKSFLCEIKVQKVIATATGSTMTIDILQSTEVFTDSFGEEIDFKWVIYGLEFHAESRAYSK